MAMSACYILPYQLGFLGDQCNHYAAPELSMPYSTKASLPHLVGLHDVLLRPCSPLSTLLLNLGKGSPYRRAWVS
jgi:hypothetical protein